MLLALRYTYFHRLIGDLQMQVAIIGLGQAAWKYDLETPNLRRSHTQSIKDVLGFEIVAGVDVDHKVASDWSSTFGIPSFCHLSDLFANFKPDLIVISVPISELYETLIQVLNMANHGYILIEKPVANSFEQCIGLANLKAVEKNRVLVNLPRLFASESVLISKVLHEQVDLSIEISGSYSGSLLNTSLHFISLINLLVPKLQWQFDLSNNFNIFREGTNRVEKIGTILQSPNLGVSTFDFRIIGRGISVDYRDGGAAIDVVLNDRSLPIKSTRDNYQKNVYEYISVNGIERALMVSGLNKILPSLEGMICNYEPK